jgi:hypothetical protein
MRVNSVGLAETVLIPVWGSWTVGLTHIESTPPAAVPRSRTTREPQQGAALMRCSTKYVGLDVHQATTVATVRESSGKIIARSILPTEEAALLEFFAGMRGAVHVAFEEGTQAQRLHDLLSPRVSRVVVCDRRGAPRQGNKGDQVDSAQLSELLRTGQLRAVYHGRSDRLVLKELTRAYDNLVEDSMRAMLGTGADREPPARATSATNDRRDEYRADVQASGSSWCGRWAGTPSRGCVR